MQVKRKTLPPFVPKYTQPPIRKRIAEMDMALYFNRVKGLNFLITGSIKNGRTMLTPAVAIL
ncbi:MAG: hypothetical protein ACTTG8_09150 [Catonella sp.]|uniref:hypothetical protein n=1 Tax=Catonella sp. TaxID=2382125 RepID=UPI003F9F8B01